MQSTMSIILAILASSISSAPVEFRIRLALSKTRYKRDCRLIEKKVTGLENSSLACPSRLKKRAE